MTKPEPTPLPEPFRIESTIKCTACGEPYRPQTTVAGNWYCAVSPHACKCGSTSWAGTIGEGPGPVQYTAEQMHAHAAVRDAAWQAYADALVADMEARKDAAYLERNRCVSLIARMALAMGWRAGIARTAIEGWSDDWHGCVYIDLPSGQVSWHYHDSQAGLFNGLPQYDGAWDGHDTPEKYRRVGEPVAVQRAYTQPEVDALVAQGVAQALFSLADEPPVNGNDLARQRVLMAAQAIRARTQRGGNHG